MNTSLTKVAGVVRAFVLFGILSVFIPCVTSAQIGLQVPPPPRVVQLFQPKIFGLEFYHQDSTFFQKPPSAYRRSVKMDSSGRFISVQEGLDDTQFLLPAVVDIDTYVRMRSAFDRRELFKQSTIKELSGKIEKSSGAIELDIPFRIKSKTFTRIFGSDRIGLRVTGNISFDLSGRTEKRSGSAINAIENQNTFSPRFKQTQQFTVEGKIGDKVTVSVEQNSEATVDVENTLKLRYQGDEDEIVQKVEAGNISLSLPSTKYVIFGGSNQGLFGLKTQMQVGDLYFTAIASLEKGQQQELSISGGSKESTSTIKDYDFIKNRYFFVDNYYLENFESGLTKDNPTVFSYTQGTEILQLEVWKSENPQTPGVRKGIAVISPLDYVTANGDYKGVNIDDVQAVEGKIETGYFKQLEEGKDFSYDKYRGFMVLNQSMNDNDILAVAFTTAEVAADPSLPTIGTMSVSLSDSLQPVILRLIKPRNMLPSNTEVWPLMMRNVYSLGGSKIEREGFELRLENNVNGDHRLNPQTGPNVNRTYLNLLGLDVLDENGGVVENGDEQVDINPYIINLAEGTLMFPTLKPFRPDQDSRYYGAIPDEETVNMYDITPTQRDLVDSTQFEMVVTSKSTRSTFDLGFYVLEGSEVVTVGGQTLVRDRDYTIDYFSGQLTLVSNEAKRSSAELQVKYERANLFQLDKKTIFGGRLEYRFWENSFVGLTALYLNKTTLDQRVRVGQEPFSNFVWDVNAAFKFKPRIITKAINALPIVETNAPSSISIEGEFAQVLPNPNSLNNGKTGDNDGVAYVDDFESSKRTTTLGIRYRTWSPASPPEWYPSLQSQITDAQLMDKYKQRISWFNPYNQTLIKDIWPDRDVNSQTGQTTDVLGVDLMRDESVDPDSAWSGVMRSTISFADQSKTKYIEMWILGYTGTMNIDIGRISEDWYVKEGTVNYRNETSFGNLNTEDANVNGLLEIEEDLGIDGVADGDPNDDPYDNWGEPFQDPAVGYDGYNYDKINGTEGNHNSRDARYPDTEDLDGDGLLSTTNAYYEYSFSLDENDDKAKNWVKGSTEKGWRLFRIPLKEPTKVVNSPDPNFQQIYNVRMWFSDLPVERTRIRIATFDFVGNEWDERGVAHGRDSTFVKDDSLFTLATYNTEENAVEIEGGPEPYTSPPGVTGVKDRITQAVSKEQSLVMIVNDLEPGWYAEAKKTLFNAMDLLNYKNLRMFVHGDRSLPLEPPMVSATGDTMGDTSPLRFYLRFGSDSKNFYEYSQEIYAGWHKQNNIDIDLDELTSFKSDETYNASHGDTTFYIKYFADDVNSYYMAQGIPNLKNIRYFIVGVYNQSGDKFSIPDNNFTGEIWLDEMRLSNVRREKATAMRLSTNIALADVITFNAQWESREADFHNISTQFGSGNTTERQTYRGKIVLDKFLPASWDLSIPIDGSVSLSRSVPKYKPKSDELTNYRNDTFAKKLQSLFGGRTIDPELEELSSINEVYGWGTTLKTRTKSRRWYLRYTIDEMVFDFDYSRKKSSSWETLYNKSEQYKESFRYNIPFGKNNYLEPFSFLRKVPVLNYFFDNKYYYTPKTINTSISVIDAETERLLRREGSEKTRLVNTSTNRQLSASYMFIPSLNFSYSRSHKTDADFVGLKHENLLKEIITNGNFGRETDISQTFKGDFRPKVTSWLKPDYSYNNNFSYGLVNGYKYRQASNQTTHRVGLTISPGKMLKAIYTPGGSKKSKPSGGRSRRGSRRGSKSSTTASGEAAAEKATEAKKTSSFPNPLMWVYNALTGWNSVKTTISQTSSNRQQYLRGLPDWQYQFGFSQNTGVGQDKSLEEGSSPIVLVGPANQKSTSIRTTTSLNLSSFIKANLSHDYSNQETNSDYGKIRNGSRSTSYFSLDSDPLGNAGGFASVNAFIPDWNVSISKVEKLLFFDKFANSISLEHGHTSKYTEKLTLNPVDKTFEPSSSTYTDSWQPLLGMNIRTKWKVNATMRMTKQTNFSAQRAAGATKSNTDQLNVSLSYSTSSGFKIPIPVWPFKGKTFKNEITVNVAFDMSSNKTYQKQYEQKKFQATQSNEMWKLRPSATYRFSSRVQGSLFYERSTTKNKISGTYSYNEFGITVNIAIHD